VLARLVFAGKCTNVAKIAFTQIMRGHYKVTKLAVRFEWCIL